MDIGHPVGVGCTPRHFLTRRLQSPKFSVLKSIRRWLGLRSTSTHFWNVFSRFWGFVLELVFTGLSVNFARWYDARKSREAATSLLLFPPRTDAVGTDGRRRGSSTFSQQRARTASVSGRQMIRAQLRCFINKKGEVQGQGAWRWPLSLSSNVTSSEKPVLSALATDVSL